ncbi:hypothetical protein KUH03_39290 [Sphingobacterium sp. E70]|uniref:hypothetical protein n=1 Tax=Sphingobacterium sp. E70 TaxID=2853439 RepID=UPI00211BE4C0|nr:hypothetical protein [Sphingobacterium sp. E70]ULT24869.1 hypothetical protein KUH03_39290 [Sphingobacterium sp. E70]
MKKIRLLVLVFIAMYHSSWAQWSVLMDDKKYNETEFFLYQRFTQKEWDASNFAKPEDMKWFLDARYGMFVHFGLNSYVNKDMSWPIVRNRKMPDHGQEPILTKPGRLSGLPNSNLKNLMQRNGSISHSARE